jgi:hypothetical protein
VGLAAIEIGKALGARVIACASSDEKLAVCRDHGADAGINYATEDLRGRIKALTEDRGVDVVYDSVGGAYTEPAFRSLAWRGRHLVIGFAAGEIPKLPLNLALLKGASVVGVFWGDFVRREPARFAKPDRPRWRDFRRLGRLLPAGLSKWQIPVLTLADRAGGRRADMLPDRRADSLVAVLDAHVGADVVLCSDGDGAYGLFARARRLPHYRLNAKTGPRVIDTAFHIQTVNNLHSRFEAFMRPFCGPATKNLPGYAAWFIARLAGTRTGHNAAWQRLLAA